MVTTLSKCIYGQPALTLQASVLVMTKHFTERVLVRGLVVAPYATTLHQATPCLTICVVGAIAAVMLVSAGGLLPSSSPSIFSSFCSCTFSLLFFAQLCLADPLFPVTVWL